MALAAGTRIGPHEVTTQIGVGGMGEVYRATDTNLKRQVAIKVLPASLAGDSERLARFQREAETLAALNHPNIAQIHGLEKTPEFTALVMELVEGEDLSQRIARGPIPIDEALPIARQLAEALEAAHEQGIIHRDLKPANIKVRADGTVKVLDFGLAKAMEPPGAAALSNSMSPTITTPAMTQAGMILGTAAYMSPEQAKGRAVDARADIWAFGVVLFEMLSGQRAFDGEDIADMLGAVTRLEPRWEVVPASVPPRVRQVLRACLQKDVKARLAHMQDVRLALAGAFETSVPSAEMSQPVESRRSMRLALAAAVLATLLLAVISVIHFRETAPDLAVTRTSLLPPDDARWSVTSQALSPDGRHLAFLAGGEDGTSQIWVRSLDALTGQPLDRTKNATGFFWSPDGKALAFFAQGKLNRIDLAGSGVLTLADGVNNTQRGGSWGRDGTIVYAAQSTSGLTKVKADGGPSEAATELRPGERSHRYPWFLPDGRHFLFAEGNPGAGNPMEVWVGSVDSADRQRILTANSAALFAPGSDGVGHLLYLREDTLVAQPFDTRSLQTTGEALPVAQRVRVNDAARGAFSVSSEGVLSFAAREEDDEVAWFDRAGNLVGSLRGLERLTARFDLSPDGRTLAYESGQDIWLHDVERQVSTRFTSSPGREQSPTWSPDGRTLFYNALRRSGSAGREVNALYRKPISGMGPEAEVRIDINNSPGALSPDSRFLAFVGSGQGARKLWVLPDPDGPSAKSQPYQLFRDSSGDTTQSALTSDYDPAWSPDGRWLAFGSNETGRGEAYVVPFPGPGARVRVSSRGADTDAGLHFSRDGRQILFVDGGRRLVAVDIAVVSGQLQVGDSHALFTVTGRFDMSPDGRRFLVSGRRSNEPLTIVQNWTRALTR